jgi:long-subunit fatty acid transport protein
MAPAMSFAKKVKDSPWSWGLSIAAPDALATDYTVQSKFFGPVNADSELLHLRFGPAAAYQITPEFSIGARFDIDYGTLDLTMPLGRALIDLGQCDGFGISGAVGLFYKPRKNLSFGLYYETPTAIQDLESKNADGYIGVAMPGGNMYFSNLDVTVTDMQFPQNFGLGGAYSPIPSLRLSADLKYLDWNSVWDELTVKLSGPDAAEMQNAGLPTTLKIPHNIDNQWTVGVGAEYFFAERYKVSLGYHYNDDALGKNYLLPYTPAEVKHTLSAGFSFMPVKTTKISLAYMHAFMDDSVADSHGYDAALENQLGMQPGYLQSELNGAESTYNAQILQISVIFYW